MQVSVIVPVYNDRRVEQCIKSLLCQSLSMSKFEIIVVDNNSNTAIKNIIRKYPIKYLHENKQGSYFARNKGIRMAKGDIIAFTDADCEAEKEWLSHIVHAFNDTSVQGVGGRIRRKARTQLQKYSDNIVVDEQKTFQYTQFLHAPFIATANAAYRKTLLQQLGGFDTRFKSGGDADLSWRMHFAGHRMVIEPKASVYHAPRTSLLKYVKQHFIYGVAQTQLFKKYKNILPKNYFIQIVTFNDLLKFYNIMSGKRLRKELRKGNKIKEFLTLLRYAAFVSGNIYGSVINGVFFLKFRITSR